MARLNDLSLTGSVGIIIRAKREGHLHVSLQEIINKMQKQGIHLSEKLISFACNKLMNNDGSGKNMVVGQTGTL